MPRNPEIPSVHGALDSILASDGGPLDAHLLREIARNANRQIAKGELLASLSYRAVGAGTEDETAAGVLLLKAAGWTPLAPVIVPKKPGLRFARVDLVAQVLAGSTAYLAVGTLARPFDPANPWASPGSVLPLAGDGTHKLYGPLDDVPLSADLIFEVLTPYVFVAVSSTLISTATYGGVNTESVGDTPRDEWIIPDSHAGAPFWNTTGTTLRTGRVTAVLYTQDSFGNRVYEGGARTVVGVGSAGKTFYVAPKFDVRPLPGPASVGHVFELYEPNKIWIDGIAVWAKDRTS